MPDPSNPFADLIPPDATATPGATPGIARDNPFSDLVPGSDQQTGTSLTPHTDQAIRDTPGWVGNFGRSAWGIVKEMVTPRVPSAAEAAFVTNPAIGPLLPYAQAVKNAAMLAVQRARGNQAITNELIARTMSPEYRQIQEAREYPYGSKEWWDRVIPLGIEAAQYAPFAFAGLRGLSRLRTVRPGEIPRPPVPPAETMQPTAGGETDATRIESTRPVSELEVRPQVGEKAPLWREPEGAAGAQEPVSTGAPVAPETSEPAHEQGLDPIVLNKQLSEAAQRRDELYRQGNRLREEGKPIPNEILKEIDSLERFIAMAGRGEPGEIILKPEPAHGETERPVVQPRTLEDVDADIKALHDQGKLSTLELNQERQRLLDEQPAKSPGVAPTESVEVTPPKKVALRSADAATKKKIGVAPHDPELRQSDANLATDLGSAWSAVQDVEHVGTKVPSTRSGPSKAPPFAGETTAVKPPETARQSAETNALMEQLKDKPRALTQDEHALLSQHESNLQRQQDTIAQDQIAAHDSGNLERIAENDLKLSENLDKLQDVRNALKGGVKEPQLPSGMFSLDKMLKDKRAIERGRPLTPFEEKEVRDAYDKIKEKQDAVDAHLTTPEGKLYWEQLRDRAEAYKRAAAGEKGVKLKSLLPDPKLLAKMAEAEKAKQSWIDSLEKARRSKLSWWQKTPDWLLKWRRAFVISGLHSIAKLASASIEGTIVLPIRELVGSALKHLPLIDEVAKRAPGEGGGFNIRAEAAAQAEMWKNLVSDFGKNLRGEKPDFETVFGTMHQLPPELQNYVGYLHGALKSPLARNVFTRQLIKRTEFAARHGVDITDRMVQMELGRQATEDSVFWRFQNKNWLSNKYNALVSSLERQGGFLGKVGAFGVRAELPVVVVPSNILARTFEGVFGAELGGARLARAYYRGIENLKPAEADLIMRNLKTGSLGTALTLLGVFNPQTFGGFYRPGTKKEEGEPGFGQTKIGDVTIPAWLQDNPFLVLPQFGATIRQVGDSYLRKRDTETAGYWLGLYTTLFNALSSSPFVRESIEVTKSMNPRVAGDVLGEHARSILIPMAVQQIASMTDPVETRYPVGVQERMKMGIPGLREQVPETLPPQQQLGIRRRGLSPSRHMMVPTRRHR